MLINHYIRALAERIQGAPIDPASLNCCIASVIGFMAIPSLMLLILSFQHSRHLGFKTAIGIFFVDLIYTGVLFAMFFRFCPKASSTRMGDYYQVLFILGGIIYSLLFVLYMLAKLIQKWHIKTPHTFSWLPRRPFALSLVYAMMPTTVIYLGAATNPVYALSSDVFRKILIPASLFKCSLVICTHLMGNLLKVLCIAWMDKLLAKRYPSYVMYKEYVFKTAIVLFCGIQFFVTFYFFRILGYYL